MAADNTEAGDGGSRQVLLVTYSTPPTPRKLGGKDADRRRVRVPSFVGRNAGQVSMDMFGCLKQGSRQSLLIVLDMFSGSAKESAREQTCVLIGA